MTQATENSLRFSYLCMRPKVKYQNPADPEEKWTGRGRKPKWLTAQLQEGANLDDFAV
jgi:DNA-binding protein H-NS